MEVDFGHDDVEDLLLAHFEDVLLEEHGLLDEDHEEVVQGVLEDLEDDVHLQLVYLEEVEHLELVDLEDVVHLELVDEVFVELHGVEVALDDVQRLDVELDLLQLLVEDLLEVVHGLVEVLVDEVVHGLLVEHEVLVRVVAGVQVQVLQLVVTIGLPAEVMRCTSQCSKVVEVG